MVCARLLAAGAPVDARDGRGRTASVGAQARAAAKVCPRGARGGLLFGRDCQKGVDKAGGGRVARDICHRTPEISGPR